MKPLIFDRETRRFRDSQTQDLLEHWLRKREVQRRMMSQESFERKFPEAADGFQAKFREAVEFGNLPIRLPVPDSREEMNEMVDYLEAFDLVRYVRADVQSYRERYVRWFSGKLRDEKPLHPEMFIFPKPPPCDASWENQQMGNVLEDLYMEEIGRLTGVVKQQFTGFSMCPADGNTVGGKVVQVADAVDRPTPKFSFGSRT